MYCFCIGPKNVPPASKEKLTRCMGIESLRALEAVGITSVNEETKRSIDDILRRLQLTSAGCLSQKGEDVPIFFHSPELRAWRGS
jgi:hypothetical protein